MVGYEYPQKTINPQASEDGKEEQENRDFGPPSDDEGFEHLVHNADHQRPVQGQPNSGEGW